MDFSSVDVADLLKRLELGDVEQGDRARLTSGGSEIKFDCFGPEHTDGGSAYINVETTAWFCHGCKRRGNAISLVMEVQQVARPQAERFLSEHYGITFAEPIGGSMVAETEARFREAEHEPDPLRPPASWLTAVRVDWSDIREPWARYMIGRGFERKTLESWDIGYDYDTDRLTIPVFDLDGDLFGIKGRAWREGHEPKYLVLGDRGGSTRFGFEPYDPSLVVFGLHRNRECRTAVLFEGELNAKAASQLGVERPCAVGMSYFTQRHAELLAREVDEVVLYFDHGDAGEQGMWGRAASDGSYYPGAVRLLEPYVRVRTVASPPEDPSRLVELGRGQEVLDLIANAQSSLTTLTTFG